MMKYILNGVGLIIMFSFFGCTRDVNYSKKLIGSYLYQGDIYMYVSQEHWVDTTDLWHKLLG